MNWKFGYLIGILSLYVTVHAAPVSQDADGYRPVEIRTIEVVKTVTKTEGTCAHTTGLGAGYSKGLQTPSTIATTVLAAEQTSATITNPPAATSLNAAVHWDVDLQRVENLQANKTVDMFYCEHEIERRDGKAIPPSNNTAVGFLKVANMQYPSVQLEHTSYISSVDCSNSTIQVKFNNKKAFSVAHTDWSSHKSGFLLITIDPNCRLSTEEMQRGYILVKSVTAHNSTMTVTGNSEPVSFADAVGRETPIDFSFGNFQTNSTDGFNVPATGPPARINATGVSPPSSPSNGTRDPSGDSSFDEDLDRLIGVMSSEEFQTQMLGRYNVSLEDLAGDDDIPDILPGAGFRKRHLVRRGLFSSIKKGLKKIGNAVKDTVDKVGDVVKKVTGTVGDVIDKGIDTLGKWLSITKSFNKDFSFDTKKNQNTKQTPWGPGVELFSKSTPGGSGSAAVYCVDCGATGKMVLQGKVTFSVIKGLEEGYISADGNLHAGLQLGIVASYKDHWGFDKEIVTIPLTPYTIPGIITLGPSVSLSAGAQVEILAEGQLLAGFTADVLNFTARFDLKDKDKSVMPNFGPDAKPVFEGKAKIVLSAEAFLALKLAVGVKILSGVFDKSVGIVEKPKLFLKAGVDASFSRDGGGQFSDPNCKGLNIELGFGNELSLDLFGSKKTLSDIKGSIWDHCIVLQKDSTIQSPQNSASQIAPPSSIIQIAPASSSIQIAPPSSSAQTVPQSSPLVPNPPHGNTTVQTSPSSNTTVQASPNSNATVQISPNVNSTIGNLPPNTTAPIVKGSKFSRIKTWSGSLNLHYSRNANIYAVPPQNVEDPSDASGFFTADPSGDFVIGDSHGRYLHGYKTEIDGYGVGRLRLHAADAMPKTASLLSFASTTIDATGESLLVLADLAGAVYFPIVCLYEASIFPKIFLAKDPVNGVTQLEDAKLEGLITGNKVKNCGYLPMKYDV